MAQQLVEKLKELIQPILATLGYELWGCSLHHSGKITVLRIFIEVIPDAITNQRPEVSLDDCGKVSREIGAILDVEDVIKGSYTLEISSPGMDRQLFTIEQYQRFVGSLITVRLLVPMATSQSGKNVGRRNYNGKLIGVEDSAIKLQIDNDANNVLVIPVAHIDKANIIPEF